MHTAATLTYRLHGHTVTFTMVDENNWAAGFSVNGSARISSKDAEAIALKLVRGGWRVAV